MNMTQWLTQYRDATYKKALPILTFPGCGLTDYTVEQVVTDPIAQAACITAIARRYPDMAAAVGPMDLSVEAEAFGASVEFSAHEIPTVIDSILDIDQPEGADALTVPAVGSGRTQVFIDAVSLTKRQITDRPFLAGCIGPFSLAGRLMDMSSVMIACVEEPEMLETVLNKATDFLIAYVNALKEAGADGIFLAEPAAGLLSPMLNEEFSVPYVKKIKDAVADDSFLFCYHNCGPYIPRQLNELLTIQADMYHFGDAIDLSEISRSIPEHMMYSGNLSPVECFKLGNEETMKNQVTKLLQAHGQCANFIPSSGCDIPPDASLDNADCFFRAVKEYYHG